MINDPGGGRILPAPRPETVLQRRPNIPAKQYHAAKANNPAKVGFKRKSPESGVFTLTNPILCDMLNLLEGKMK